MSHNTLHTVDLAAPDRNLSEPGYTQKTPPTQAECVADLIEWLATYVSERGLRQHIRGDSR